MPKSNQHPETGIDWKVLDELMQVVPYECWKSGHKKQNLTLADHLHFETRDKGCCKMCGRIAPYGSNNIYSQYKYTSCYSQLHHVIPNEKISDANVVTLCIHCHQIIHLLLYVDRRWRYAKPL